MSIARITSEPRTMPPGPFAQAYRVDSTIYIAGQIAFDPATQALIGDDVATQTAQVVQNLRTILRAAGGDLENIVKLTCVLPRLHEDYAAFNEAFVNAFGGHSPARTTIGAELLPGCLVEIEAIAAMTK